jgi:hypothetical protein
MPPVRPIGTTLSGLLGYPTFIHGSTPAVQPWVLWQNPFSIPVGGKSVGSLHHDGMSFVVEEANPFPQMDLRFAFLPPPRQNDLLKCQPRQRDSIAQTRRARILFLSATFFPTLAGNRSTPIHKSFPHSRSLASIRGSPLPSTNARTIPARGTAPGNWVFGMIHGLKPRPLALQNGRPPAGQNPPPPCREFRH